VRMRLPPPSRNLLRDLVREFDGYLRQSETPSIEPWQLEIRDYLRWKGAYALCSGQSRGVG
jgi:hypothetical protein